MSNQFLKCWAAAALFAVCAFPSVAAGPMALIKENFDGTLLDWQGLGNGW